MDSMRYIILFRGMLVTLKPKKEYVELFKTVILDIAKTKASEHRKEGVRFAKRLEELRTEREKILTAMINDPNYEMLDREEYLSCKRNIDARKFCRYMGSYKK